MDVFRQRLEDEYDAQVIITAPTVPYKGVQITGHRKTAPSTKRIIEVIYKDRTEMVSNPTNFPDITDVASRVREVHEPIVKATIIVPEGRRTFSLSFTDLTTPLEYLGEMMDLCYSHRSGELEYKYLDTAGSSARIIMTCILPLSEIVTDFFDKLKSRSSGFASFECVYVCTLPVNAYIVHKL